MKLAQDRGARRCRDARFRRVQWRPGAAAETRATIEIWSSLPRQGSSKAQTDTIVNAIKMAIEEKRWQGRRLHHQVHRQGRLDRCRRQVGRGDRDQERQRCGRDRQARRLHRHVQLGRGQAVDPDPVRQGHRHGQPGQHGCRPDQAVRGQGEPDKYYPDGCKQNYTRVVPADDLQGNAGATGRPQLGVKNVYVLDDTEVYGKGIADVFDSKRRRVRPDRPRARRHRRQGDRLQGARREDQGDQPRPRVLRRHHPEQRRPAVARPARRDARRQADGPRRHLRERVPRGRRAAAEGSYITFGGVPPDQLPGKGKEFVDKYTAKYPNNPIEGYTAYGYEAAKSSSRRIEKAAATNPADVTALRAAVLDAVKAPRTTTACSASGRSTPTATPATPSCRA